MRTSLSMTQGDAEDIFNSLSSLHLSPLSGIQSTASAVEPDWLAPSALFCSPQSWVTLSASFLTGIWFLRVGSNKIIHAKCFPATSKCSVLVGDYYYSSLFSPGAATHFHSAVTLNMTFPKPNMSSLHKLAFLSLFLRVQLFPATLLKTLKPCLTSCSSEYISKFPVSLSHWSFPFSFCYYTT